VLGRTALVNLDIELTRLVAELSRRCESPGQPKLVEEAAEKVHKKFAGQKQLKPDERAIYRAALRMLRGEKLSLWEYDLVAFGINMRVAEVENVSPISSLRFEGLLLQYSQAIKKNDFWPLSWFALLNGYFAFDPQDDLASSAKNGWEQLRKFLQDSWPAINKTFSDKYVPDWIGVLRREPTALANNPADKYALSYLKGDEEPINLLAKDLGIPESSWFWHSVVTSVVQKACDQQDDEFVAMIPKLLGLLRKKPAFKDESIAAILVRYHRMTGAPPHQELKDYVTHYDIWKNPKLKLIGQGGASWNRVPESVWRMVLQWVNKRNLRDFFEILAARNQADAGRLEFWTRYIEQIHWTRLIFGTETLSLRRRIPEVRKLIEDEQGMAAVLTSPQKKLVDAFMMQLGDYVVVEFSKKPNACYVYKADELPFEPYASEYDGGSSDLAVGPNGEFAARIVHTPGWQSVGESDLNRLGIKPDRKTTKTSSGNSRESDILSKTKAILSRYPGSTCRDDRNTTRGCIWVEDPQERTALGRELSSLGFDWSLAYNAWYRRGD
jgi:hypothetical protein